MSSALLRLCETSQAMVALCKAPFGDGVLGIPSEIFFGREDLYGRVSQWVSVDELPREFDGPYFPYNHDWTQETEPKLLRHLIDGHLNMMTRRPYEGVPRYDLEVAKAKRFSAQSLVPLILRKLGRSDEDIRRDFLRNEHTHPGQPKGAHSPQDYRTTLVRTLRYMQDLGIAEIPWQSAQDVYPGAQSIEVNPRIHSRDQAFLMMAALP